MKTRRLKNSRLCHYLIAGLIALVAGTGCSKEPALRLEPEDRIVLVGNALADRMQHDGWLESWLQAAHPEHQLIVRILGVSGDRLDHQPRSCSGSGDETDVIYVCTVYYLWHTVSMLLEL